MRKLIGVVALGVAGFVLAQGQYPSFEEVDTNQDGQLSRSELAAIEGLEFSAVDTNQDGTVDRQEYMAATGDEGADSGLPDSGIDPGAGSPGADSPGAGLGEGAGSDVR